MRATDPIHRNIEDHLRSKGLFYDRKKGYYRNLGKPIKSIVSIPYLAQAVLAIAMQRPNDARARPSSLLKDDAMYERIFSPQYPLDLFLACASLMRKVESYVHREQIALSRADQNNLRFYVAMHAALRATATPKPSVKEYAALQVDSIGDPEFAESLKSVRKGYESLGGTDQVAKGPGLVKKALASAKRSIAKSVG